MKIKIYKNEKLKSILLLLELGFSVIPIKPNGKLPLIKWKDFQKRFPTEDEVKQWLKKWPDMNIAIVTGEISKCFVLDVDGEEGYESLRKEFSNLPRTLNSKTGRGEHFFFKHPGGFIETKSKIFSGLDIRGDGGYVVVPPSIHETDVKYSWEFKPTEIQLAEAPEVLLDKLKTTIKPTKKGFSSNKKSKKTVGGNFNWRKIVKSGAKEGERNDTLTSLVGTLINGGKNFNDIYELAQEYGGNCTPPMKSKEVGDTVVSIWNRDLKKFEPERIGENGTVGELIEKSKFSELNKDSSPEEIGSSVNKLISLSTNVNSTVKNLAKNRAIEILTELGIRQPFKLINDAQKEFDRRFGEDKGAPSSIWFEEVDPWDEIVDLSELLGQTENILSKYLFLPEGGSNGIALWIAASWVFDNFDKFPNLMFQSPVMRCGKTTALTIISKLTSKPILVSNITPATVFRLIEKYTPTLIFDEADLYLKTSDNFNSILNSGNSRETAFVGRSSGDQFEPRIFSTWGPKVIACIGKQRPTLEDRSIIIPIKRRLKSEKVVKLRQNSEFKSLVAEIQRKFKRFSDDFNLEIDLDSISLPKSLNDREEENWLPLRLISIMASPEWEEKCKTAMELLTGSENKEESDSILLLKDIKTIFESEEETKFPTKFFLKKLNAMEHRPWAEYYHGKELSPVKLASILSHFEICPKPFRFKDRVKRGYSLDQFKEIFPRYIPGKPQQTQQKKQKRKIKKSSKSLKIKWKPRPNNVAGVAGK